MRYVVTFHAVGNIGQGKGFLQVAQRDLLAVGVIRPLGFQSTQGVGGVFCSHCQQFFLGGAARQFQRHLFAIALGTQPLLDDLRFFHRLRQDDFLRYIGGLFVILLDELLNDLGVLFVLGAFEDEIFAPDQAAGADEEDLHTGFVFFTRHGDDVGIHGGDRDDLLAFNDAFDGGQFVPYGGGTFKLQRFCCLFHLRCQSCNDLLSITIEELAQFGNRLAVVFTADGADAGCGAQFDVVIQAGACIGAGDVTVTGQVGEDAPQGVQGLMHRPGAGVRAVIQSAVFEHLAGDGHFGVVHLPVDFDVRIAFVVFEADVEMRPVLLDQVHLKDEGF